MTQPRLLLVDDEEPARRMMGRFLQGLDVVVAEAADGAEAFARFQQENAHIVLTDVRMPQVGGLELTRKILALWPETLVVIITGHGNEQTAIEALRAGAVNYLTKPVDILELERTLHKLLAVIETRESQRFDPSLLEAAELRLRIPNNPRLALGVTQFLGCIAAKHFKEGRWQQMQLGLVEMITNAIEHGNLGLTYEEKTRALREGNYESLFQNRASNPDRASRQVTVDCRVDADGFACTISDEGPGFNWRGLPDPLDPENLLSEHGRGILVARLSFDQVIYNEKGNQVQLVKWAR